MRALIIGAGCTGLLVAQGLRKHGIPATVFEASSKDRRLRDWTMMVHWGAEYMHDLLPDDVFYQLRDAETDPWISVEPGKQSERPIWNGKTGEVHVWLKNVVFKRYSRKRLCEILRRGADVQFDKELSDIRLKDDGRVEAVFADGSIEAGDVLVGADSANSRVRSWLFDGAPFAKSSELPMVVYNFCTRYADADFARRLRDYPNPLMKVSTHPDHATWYMIALLEVPDPNRPEDWSFQHFMTHYSPTEMPSQESEERLAHFKALGSTYADPFKSATAKVDEATFVPNDRLKHWAEPRLWDNQGGRVTLAGDAAHPFPPHRAQGLNNAIQDAANLVMALIDAQRYHLGTLPSAISSYDIEMFERGKQEMLASTQQAYDATHMGRFLSSTLATHGHMPLPKADS